MTPSGRKQRSLNALIDENSKTQRKLYSPNFNELRLSIDKNQGKYTPKSPKKRASFLQNSQKFSTLQEVLDSPRKSHQP